MKRLFNGPAALIALAMVAAGCQLLAGIDPRHVEVDGGQADAAPGQGDAALDVAAEACASACTPDEARCEEGGMQICVGGSNGCNTWGPTIVCSGTCIDGGCGNVAPPSCMPGGAGMTNCGPAATESCCTTLEVPPGTYDRSYDGVSFGFTNPAWPATLSGFRLDKYEVTVGRFRQFVNAMTGGWKPAQGSGKHVHLNGGKGLNATAGGYEPGWDSSWTHYLATTLAGWTGNIGGGSWTAMPGPHESLPISEVFWWDAYAFCIWDGGFLPSEAEWNYAATGGADQRAYPWSLPFPPGSTSIDCAESNFFGCSDGGLEASAGASKAVGSTSPLGDGKWGQSDLSGGVWEWNLDASLSYVTPCVDCANTATGAGQAVRGGGFHDTGGNLLSSHRYTYNAAYRADAVGVRCARVP